ncbi:MAG: IS200/IS605 family transposase [Gemmatimonadales bacterium]
MRHRLYYHLVWTTRDREPSVTARLAEFLCRYLRHVALEERARILEIGAVSTHLHLLLAADPQTPLPRLIQRLKGGSARVAFKDNVGVIRWAQGYNLETITPSDIDGVRAYLRSQPTHHPEQAIDGWRGDAGIEETRQH